MSDQSSIKDQAFYRRIGGMGGRSTLEKHGTNHFVKAGRKGGQQAQKNKRDRS